jgi:hypothetical protein
VAHGHSIHGQVVAMVRRPQIESVDHEYGTERPKRALSRYDPHDMMFFNATTPEEYAKAQYMYEEQH